jgi:predicted N-acetyltransferase YhbS
VTLRVESLEPSHDLTTFTSGNDELDSRLRLHAHTATGQGTRMYVVVDDGGTVVGYFSIAPHLLEREAAPKAIGRGGPTQIPAILLAKLALSDDLHGQGLGAELLVCALRTMTNAARSAGGKVIVVDAIDDDAAAFYEHHDFVALPNHAHRLVMKTSTAAKALGIPWP